jgi:2-polyprenyl-6-methoxyphenol hydroxylase-like FAD-dependent oxidoreductase
MASVERILIVGGGIGGLTLAMALHKHGFKPQVVEWSPEWRTSGTGIGVLANAMRVMRTLGIDRAVLEGGEVLHHWSYVDARGELLSVSNLEEMWGDVGPCVGIDRGTLHQALLTGTAGVPARLGIGPIGLTQHAYGVSVAFSDSSQADYDLVVGADGVHSTVRKLLFGGITPRYAGQVVWRSIV